MWSKTIVFVSACLAVLLSCSADGAKFTQLDRTNGNTTDFAPPSAGSDSSPFSMDLCLDFHQNPKRRIPAKTCQKHEVMFLTGLPFGHSPMTADLANDSCSWKFDCFTDSRRDNFMSSGQKRALWWEAVLKVPAQNGRIRKQCQTNRGRGVCVPLKKHEIVVRYPTKSSTNSKPCFYWRKVKTSFITAKSPSFKISGLKAHCSALNFAWR